MKKLIFLGLVAVASHAMALSIDWTGGYRIEYTEVDRPSLAESKERKSYGLNFLYLQPKIVASDGINIVGRFDVLSNPHPAYQNSQLGSLIGGGTLGGVNPRVTSQAQESALMRVSQLYLNVDHEYGSLVAGRAPIGFGLGMTHNPGTNPFDHWYDTKDMVGYKFIIDNISFMPVLARIHQEDFGQGKTISDQIFIFEYDNKDIGAKAGVFHQTRRSSLASNDAPATIVNPPLTPSPTLESGWSSQTVNLFFGRSWEAFQFKLEASFLTGDTGYNFGGNPITFNSYAVAAELMMPAKESKFEYSAKFGVASGDDPTTTNTIEGYQMDPNYDVAMLLFNHRMGQRDFLTTGISRSKEPSLNVGNSADDEMIGNAIYVAPTVKYAWSEQLDIKGTLIYGQLMANPTNSLDFKKDLGTELDLELMYKPRERVIWSNQLGILMPGSAWKDGASNLDSKMNFGIATKAAITF